MASRESSVDIKVRTLADTSGADKINAALGILDKSEKQLAASRAQFLTATEAEVAEVNRLTEAAQRQQAARAAQAKAEAAAAAQMEQSTKLQSDAMRRLEEAAQRTQRFFAPQAVNPWVTASAGAVRTTDALSNAQGRAAGSAQNLGTQVLYLSRGFQDFQAAGMMGVANNLEQIAMSMGLGAGLAGVVTVLGVAVQTLGPHVVTWLKSLDTEGAKLEALIGGLKRAATAIGGDYSSNTDNATRVSEAFTKMLETERKALEANARAIDANVKQLQQRADVQKTADEQKLAADIEDIKAQNLPPDQEKAAIAARKREALDAKKALDDQAADAQISGAADKLTGQAKTRDDLQARAAALEQEKRQAVEYNTLLAEQEKLEKKAAEAKHYARMEQEMFAKAGMAVPEGSAAKRENERVQSNLEANKARQKEILTNAPEGRMRGVDEISAQLNQTKADAKAAADQTEKDAAALRDQVAAEKIAKVGRDNTYQREADKIAREQNGGVYDQGNLNAPPPGIGFTPTPLPQPAAPGSTLPAPMLGPAELNPPRVGTTAPAQTFGPQPTTATPPPAPFGKDVAELDRKRAEAEAAGLKEEAEKHRKAAEQALQNKLDAANHNTVTAMDIGDEAGKQRGLDDAAKYRDERDRRAEERKKETMSAPGPVAAPAAAPQSGQGSEKIVSSNQKANDAIEKLAEAVAKSNDAMVKRVAALEQKIRNQGVKA